MHDKKTWNQLLMLFSLPHLEQVDKMKSYTRQLRIGSYPWPNHIWFFRSPLNAL